MLDQISVIKNDYNSISDNDKIVLNAQVFKLYKGTNSIEPDLIKKKSKDILNSKIQSMDFLLKKINPSDNSEN